MTITNSSATLTLNPALGSQAVIPAWARSSISRQALAVLGGVGALALLAQVAIPLPFTPVPVTGQTFGVYLLALLFGRRLGATTFAAYLGVGFLGAPVFAKAASGFAIGPTFGYLMGMGIAAWVVGGFSDRGATRSFRRAWLATLAGSACVFAGGLTVLSFFVPMEQLLIAGFLPFLPGDAIKTTLAASMAVAFSARRKSL